MISKGNHVKFARFVWLAVGEEAKQRPGLQVNVYCRDMFFRLIKQLLDSVFVISRIIKVSVRDLDLDYSGYHKKPHPIMCSYQRITQ